MKTSDEALLSALSGVFRRFGYEGASMTELTRATGLQRASLYHRFPEGKQQMAGEVVSRVIRQVAQAVSQLARDESLSPEDKLKHFKKFVLEIYQGGELPCLIDSMSYQCQETPHGALLQKHVRELLDALELFASRSGLEGRSARDWGLQTLIRIEGSLVAARALQDPKIFQKTIAATGFKP